MKLVYLYSTIKMMHGPINIRFTDTLIKCNTHCFSTAAVVTRTRLSVTLYEHYLLPLNAHCLCTTRFHKKILHLDHTLYVCMFGMYRRLWLGTALTGWF